MPERDILDQKAARFAHIREIANERRYARDFQRLAVKMALRHSALQCPWILRASTTCTVPLALLNLKRNSLAARVLIEFSFQASAGDQ